MLIYQRVTLIFAQKPSIFRGFLPQAIEHQSRMSQSALDEFQRRQANGRIGGRERCKVQ